MIIMQIKFRAEQLEEYCERPESGQFVGTSPSLRLFHFYYLHSNKEWVDSIDASAAFSVMEIREIDFVKLMHCIFHQCGVEYYIILIMYKYCA